MLECECTQSLSIGDYTVQYIKADKKVRNIKNPWISQYYLVALDDSNVKLLGSLDSFYQFQKSLLADSFFDIKNDIRWNLYLTFLVEDSRLLDTVPIFEIENDDKYARKYFFTYEDGIEFFQKERFFKTQSIDSSLPSNPLTGWYEILKSVDLTGVLTEKFLKNNVNTYLSGSAFLTTENIVNQQLLHSEKSKESVVNQDKKYLIERINRVSLGDFRKHCFRKEQEFFPSLVNLIHGSNGCGKTSILEAIEFSLTGEIKRLKDFNENFQLLPDVSATVTTKAGESSYVSSKSYAINKELDRVWYGTPTGREKSTLNNNFNHFNSFNSVTAYKFALEESLGQNDYSERFSRLIYDDDTLSMEKLWRKYRDYFEEELERKRGNLESKKVEVNKVQREIDDTQQQVSQKGFYDLLEDIKYKFNTPSATENSYEHFEEIYASLQALKPFIRTFHSQWLEQGFITFSQLEQEIKRIGSEIDSIQSDLISKQESKDTFEAEKKRYLQEISDYHTKKTQNEKIIKETDNSLTAWKNCRLILDNRLKVNEYNAILDKERSILAIKEHISLVNAKYPSILRFTIDDVKVMSDELIKDTLTNLESKKQDLNILETQLNVTSGSIEKIGKLRLQLSNIGMEMLAISNRNNICPLCGTTHQDSKELIQIIKQHCRNTSNEEKLIVELEKRKSNLINQIEQINHELATNRKKQQNLELLKEVVKEINSFSPYTLDINTEVMLLLSQLHQVIAELNNMTNEHERLITLIKAFESEGYTSNAIAAADIFKNNNEYYKKFMSENMGEKFDSYIVNLRQNSISLIEKSSLNVEILDRQIKDLDYKISILGIEVQEKLLSELKQRFNVITQLNNDSVNLTIYFKLTKEDDVVKWLQVYEKTFLELDVIITQIKVLKRNSEKRKLLEELNSDLKVLEEQILRGGLAIEKLNSLKSLNEYSIQFIDSNIKRIQYFFKALHTPREFKSLGVDSEGIYAIREKDKETIRMYQMSTGQRVSLALAIMFSLYIAAPRAPQFLLLDEPVANMDDLHLLNLIDILREFALYGAQVIVTTANPDVAGLFRRKFSFFGSEFKHYELVRSNNDCTEIITLEFNPFDEEAKVLSNVS
jgi:exonuclease SbcC